MSGMQWVVRQNIFCGANLFYIHFNFHKGQSAERGGPASVARGGGGCGGVGVNGGGSGSGGGGGVVTRTTVGFAPLSGVTGRELAEELLEFLNEALVPQVGRWWAARRRRAACK